MTAGLIELSFGLQPRPWADNLVSPVLFSDAFEDIIDRVDPVVEVDPHSTLSGSIRQILKGGSLAYVSCLRRRTDAVDAMRDLACELVRLGYPVSLRSVNSIVKTTTPTFVPDLPTYPWNHSRRHWVESRVNRDIRQKRFPPHELLGLCVSGGTSRVAKRRNFLRLSI